MEEPGPLYKYKKGKSEEKEKAEDWRLKYPQVGAKEVQKGGKNERRQVQRLIIKQSEVSSGLQIGEKEGTETGMRVSTRYGSDKSA